MSIRPLIYEIRSCDPLKSALGSGDVSLLDKFEQGLVDVFGGKPDAQTRDEMRKFGESFVKGELVDGLERGEWALILLLLARRMKLLLAESPLNDDWKWWAWDEFHQEVANDLSPSSQQLLHYLVEGRPLKASGMSCNGSYYAWLEPGEVSQLRAELAVLFRRRPELSSAVDGFGEELLSSLNSIDGRSALLVAV
jgi:hypothetical protein